MIITACHDLSITSIDRIEDGLYNHNREATGHYDGQGLAFEVLDAERVQIGAIAGYTWARMAEIRQLWIDKNYRGKGLGQKLLESAIAEADTRRCLYVWATTHCFQAPGLYEKCGFVRVAELTDWPPGYTKIILKRSLSP